ncbi:hypothetical protein B0H12DRAFT_959421, partial [Mycena haematopus]
RSFKFCPGFNVRGEDTSTHIYDQCDYCMRFFVRCCRNNKLSDEVCHAHPLVFVDWSCRRNGQLDAYAGIGWAMGESEEHQCSIPVTHNVDP